MFSTFAAALSILGAVLLSRSWDGDPPTVIDWKIDNLDSIGGHRITVLGNPQVISTNAGPALLFDGEDDAVIMPTNPIAGARAFTVEIVFRPDPDGPAEQRFLHMQSTETRRLLIETRVRSNDWFLDTFLKYDESDRTLQEPEKLHPVGDWYHAALVYDGREMHHYVDGVREISGAVAFSPLESGQTSIGCRLNRVFWFKGAIRRIRVTHAALRPEEFLK